MNVYVTTGTYEYLKNLKQKHSSETMVIMQNPDTALIMHETEGPSVFNEPRDYEVIDTAGTFESAGFAVLNNIPVTDEGRPVFEYHFKNRPRMIENEPGFTAFRLLRPLSSNTYIILTLWENEEGFEGWQKSKAYEKVHEKRGTEAGVDQQPIFAGSSYVTKYEIAKEE